jgi:murein DD-endopeptidase MepM/ murein hydrolase activator NlpD
MKNKIILYSVAAVLMLAAGSLACILTSRVFNSVNSFRNTQPTIEIAASVPTQAPTQQPKILPTEQPDIQPTVTEAAIEPTETSSLDLGLCEEEVCIRDGAFVLLRPLGENGRVTVDPSYRYGEFRKNSRYPNLGVEFLNSTGTPVVAAAQGSVLVAGNDNQTAYERRANQYGNLIILEHSLAGFDQPIYTLYAHLSEILVETGDTVSARQEIGRVGSSGNVSGSVLHFEVRVGENTYSAVRNPELWMTAGHDENGQDLGALAGRIIDRQGNIINITNIVAELLDPAGESVVGRTYLRTYGGESLLGQAPWEESFGLGDLIPGTYKLSFLLNGYQQRLVDVQPGKLTLINIIQ